MNSVDFCFWLQGYLELSNAKEIKEEELQILRNHLNLVFVHEIDPMRDKQTSTPAKELCKIHGNDTLMRC